MSRLTSPHESAAADYDALARGVAALRREILGALGDADLRHLRRVVRWGRLCEVLGYATAWIAPNLPAVLLLSQGNLTRWLLMHHVGHGGYDRVPGVPRRYTSRAFARGR